MNIKPDGLFTEFDLTPEEEISALNNRSLLAYLHTKRAAYATAFMQSQMQDGKEGEVLELERQRAKLSILTELISEVLQCMEHVAEQSTN